MNIEHERLKEILAEAAAKDTAEDRAGYLDAACQGDPDLRQYVEALLAAHDRAGDFLAHSVVPPEPPPASEGPGSVIGRYKLLEEIGEGGFGRVFMAEQTAPVHRKVALKIIKAGMDTREVIARFEAERQALALMDHPNIAHVLDAGATDTGRPYFVMEIVRGIPITEYCDQQQLPTAERLELFMKVCAAVQHAHQKGIIHRDLKPSNILVTLIDGAAVPKVIDFGVAKALGQQLTEKTLFTSLQQMIGTPAYMSPEQAELSGVDVDTRSDIYSLGVLLYELLTGMTPFDPQTLRQAALDEIRRLIRETEPPKPSTRLMELARGRKSEVRSQKWKEVHGDLDWIAMKCLEKDRVRRYETASNLAQDIERHLNHEPVTAGAPGALYRIGKFIRRHRFGMATAAALVALLVAGATVSTWQAVRATRAEKEARTMVAFLEDMLNSVKPEEAKGKDTTLLRQMLDRAAARVDTELKSQPLTEAGLRHTLGGVYLALGEYPKAEPMFRRSLEVREGTLGKEHPDTLKSVNGLALLLYKKGDYAGAERLFRRALEACERTLGKEHPDTLASVNNLAGLLQTKGDYAGAEPLARRALDVRERTLGKEHPDTLASLNNLAVLLERKGDYAGAEPLCRRALEVQERTLGKVHPNTLASLHNLALLLEDKGDYAGAEPLYRRALEAYERTLGKEHSDTLRCVNCLANLLSRKGDYAGAESLYRRALEANERTLGKEHLATLHSVGNMAGLLADKGDYAGAEPLYRRTLEACERTLGKEHPYTLGSMNNLARLLFVKGDYAGAESLCRRALEAQERTLGKEHPDTLSCVNNLALVLSAKGDYAGAEPLHRRDLEACEHTLGKEHPDTLKSVNNLALVLYKKGDYAGAEPLFRQALEARERTLGKEHPATLATVDNLALLLEAKHDYAGAEPLYRRALEARKKLLGNEHLEVACDLDRLGRALGKQPAKSEEAGQVLRESLAMHRKLGGPDHPHVPGVLSSLADLLRSEGKLAETEALYREALTIAGNGSGKTLNAIAWTLATSGNPKSRDGRNAVLFAEKAVGTTDRKNQEYLDTLAAAYAEAGQFTNAAAVQREAMALLQSDAQKNDYASRLRLYESGIPYRDSAVLAEQVRVLLAEGKFAQAEPLARECLTIHERQLPDDWQTFNIQSLLGGCLLGQKKVAEAEPLLLSGYEGMKQREDQIPASSRPLLKEALQRLVQLYETTDRTDQAKEWKQKLAEFEQAESVK